MSLQSSTRVFVGNISYDSTEQQLTDLFSEIGTVVNFTIVTDRDTGKPKGFGFCDFTDGETAKSAIRNLDKHDFHGRSLRVAFADDEYTKDANASAARILTSADHIEVISKTVSLMSHQQRVELLSQMKNFISLHPAAARQLLVQNTQLGHILLHIQLQFGMVKPSDIQAIQQPIPGLTAPPVLMVQPPVMNQPLPHMIHPHPNMILPPPPHMMNVPPQHMMPQPNYIQPPQHYRGPVMQPPPPQPVHTQLSPEHQALLQQVMSLSPEQFAALPHEVQQQVIQLQMRVAQGF